MCEDLGEHSVRLAVAEDRLTATVDVLSSVLRELRIESAAYWWLELGEPYQVGFDQPGLRGLHIVHRGGCLMELQDSTVEQLAAGDLVILPRGDAHLLRSSAAGAPTISSFDLAMRTQGNRLHVGGAAVDTVVICGAFITHEPDHPALRGLPRVIHVPGEAAGWLAPFIETLRAEAFHGGPGSELVMSRLSDALLARALRHHGDTVTQPGWLAGLGDPYVAPALAALHEDLARPWTLTSLARTAGLSRAAFAARFTNRVGEPAMRYLLSLRMQRAKTLLRGEQATLSAIAAQVGYQSDVAFATAFKRETGTTPGAYRSAVGGD